MSILERVGPDTISRLQSAAKRRCAEADWLVGGKHYLAALYFYGYVAEIILGSAYFRMIGYNGNDPILPVPLKKALDLARSRSTMKDKAHPVDGLALLLIEEKANLYGPAYEKRTERSLRESALILRENWGPKLRYRAIELKEDHIELIRKSAHWFLENSQKL
jgi:hypothetical protein